MYIQVLKVSKENVTAFQVMLAKCPIIRYNITKDQMIKISLINEGKSIMELEEYLIRSGISIRTNPNNALLDETDLLIESISNDVNLFVKFIETDYVFPRLCHLPKSKNVLIWDKSYWEIYWTFLYTLSDLNEVETRRQNVLIQNKYQENIDAQILIPLTYYLALIVKEKRMASAFALYYYQHSSLDLVLHSSLSIEELEEYVKIGKFYLYVHEQIHFIYWKDPNRKITDLKGLIQQLDIASLLISHLSNSFCELEYLRTKQQMLEMVETASKDKHIQEELLCDMYAMNHCLMLYRDIWKNKKNDGVIISQCIEAVNILKFFNSVLLALRIFWQECSCDISKISVFQRNILNRTYLAEFLGITQLARQGIHDLDILKNMKFRGFEDNYLLEGIIHSTFLSGNAVKFWKDLVSTVVDSHDDFPDKFSLLKWKVFGDGNKHCN